MAVAGTRSHDNGKKRKALMAKDGNSSQGTNMSVSKVKLVKKNAKTAKPNIMRRGAANKGTATASTTTLNKQFDQDESKEDGENYNPTDDYFSANSNQNDTKGMAVSSSIGMRRIQNDNTTLLLNQGDHHGTGGSETMVIFPSASHASSSLTNTTDNDSGGHAAGGENMFTHNWSGESSAAAAHQRRTSEYLDWRKTEGIETTTLEYQKREVQRYVREKLFSKLKFITGDDELEYTGG